MVSIGTVEEMIASGEYEIVHRSVNENGIITHRGEVLSRDTSSDWRNLLGKDQERIGKKEHNQYLLESSTTRCSPRKEGGVDLR